MLGSVGVRETWRPALTGLQHPGLWGGDCQFGFFQCQVVVAGGLNGVAVYAGGDTGLGDAPTEEDGDNGGDGRDVE